MSESSDAALLCASTFTEQERSFPTCSKVACGSCCLSYPFKVNISAICLNILRNDSPCQEYCTIKSIENYCFPRSIGLEQCTNVDGNETEQVHKRKRNETMISLLSLPLAIEIWINKTKGGTKTGGTRRWYLRKVMENQCETGPFDRQGKCHRRQTCRMISAFIIGQPKQLSRA